jgi:hypothetical protein
MSKHVQLSKEELAALDSLIEQFKVDAQVVPAVVAAVATVVAAAAATVQAVTAVVTAVGSKRSVEMEPLEKIALNMLQGKLSAEDLIELRKTVIVKK